MERIFYSKVGNMYYLLILCFGGLMVYHLWVKQVLWGILFFICTYWLIKMLTQLRYVLTTDNRLRIEPGKQIVLRLIPVENIVGVRAVKGKWRSFCGMSFDQLEIRYRSQGKEICFYISPLNRQEMAKALKKRNENISIENF